jgi:hypothetical protein
MPRVQKKPAASKTKSENLAKIAKTQQLPTEQPNVEKAPEKQSVETPPAKSGVKKYIVQCKYHIPGAVAYRVYASSKEDAEHIARLRFEEDALRGRLLDTVSAVEVVNE